MKRILAALLAGTMAVTSLVGCSSEEGSAPVQGNQEASTEDALKVALLIPGNLGDKSFYDAANNGVKKVEEELGAEVKVVEMGTDQTKWEPTVLDFSEQDWDVIISGSWDMTPIFNEIGELYPDKKYINFDTSEPEVVDNVYSMFYRTNELAFLAGSLAAIEAEEKGQNTIGFIGGMDNPGINDFLLGYIEGAQHVNKDIKVATAYAGSFVDATKGKEVAISMYNQGIDIIFQVAGQTGLGVIDAAKELDKYVIGVDSDQALAFMESDKEKAEHVVTSAIKKIDESILRAVNMHVEGTLPYGSHEVLGVAEGGVGLAKNEIYKSLVSEENQARIEAIEAQITNGEVEVSTAFGLSNEEIAARRDAVRP